MELEAGKKTPRVLGLLLIDLRWTRPRQSLHGGAWFAELGGAVILSGSMAVSVEMHHTGDSGSQREVAAVIEHVLADRPGDWRVSIVGSQANDRWEMKIVGPNGFERSYTLEGSAGEHRPEVIRVILGKMLPGKKAWLKTTITRGCIGVRD